MKKGLADLTSFACAPSETYVSNSRTARSQILLSDVSMPTMFVCLPSYPPRAHARTWVNDAASLGHLPLPKPSSSTSSGASKEGIQSLQTAWRGSQLVFATDSVPSWQPLQRWASSTDTPSPSDEQLLQLLDAITADNDTEMLDDAAELACQLDAHSPRWQLAAACVAPALPLVDAAASSHDVDMVDISRTLSYTLLDCAPGGCGSLEQPLPELSMEEISLLAADTLAGCGDRDELARAALEALSGTAPDAAQLASHPIQVVECLQPPARGLSRDLEEAFWAWETCYMEAAAAEGQPLSFPQGDSSPIPIPPAQLDSCAAMSSDDWREESCQAQVASGSDASDARSGSTHAQPVPVYAASPVSAAAPDPSLRQPGADSATACGPAAAGPGRQHSRVDGRRRRAGAGGFVDAHSKLQRNRQLQKEYTQRKRVRLTPGRTHYH